MKNKLGFTLIEVLIVISIIGVLSTLTLLGTSGFRASGRDAKRITDLRQISNAMELYYAKMGSYPADATWDDDLVSEKIVTIVPSDPGDNNYEYAKCNTGYILKATLEQTKPRESYVKGNVVDGCGKSCVADTSTLHEYCIKY